MNNIVYLSDAMWSWLVSSYNKWLPVVTNFNYICEGGGVGSGRFSYRSLSKAGEGWIKSSVGMAR